MQLQNSDAPHQERVLVVDDDANLRSILARALRSEGLTVDLAADGVEGLDRVREYLPSVILLDLMMPRMDGREFIDRCGALMGDRRIPIVVATGERNALEGASELYDKGVVAVMPKPFDLDMLIAVIHGLAEPSASRLPAVGAPLKRTAARVLPETMHRC